MNKSTHNGVHDYIVVIFRCSLALLPGHESRWLLTVDFMGFFKAVVVVVVVVVVEAAGQYPADVHDDRELHRVQSMQQLCDGQCLIATEVDHCIDPGHDAVHVVFGAEDMALREGPSTDRLDVARHLHFRSAHVADVLLLLTRLRACRGRQVVGMTTTTTSPFPGCSLGSAEEMRRSLSITQSAVSRHDFTLIKTLNSQAV